VEKIRHDKTHVILIANGDFPELGHDHDIPNVKANLSQLQEALTKNVGIPAENIHPYLNKPAGFILEEFQRIAKSCAGNDATLIAYYAGHGLPIPDEGLYWATFDTKKDGGDLIYSSAISAGRIKSLMEKCNAERKILIADCCYAAEFLEGLQGDLPGFLQTNMKDIKGTFYMFSSGPDAESTFPLDNTDHPTFFTEALIRSLKEGVEAEQEVCTMGKIYSKVVDTIGQLRLSLNKKIPDPAKRIDGKADDYILYLNPKYRNLAETDLEKIFENPNRKKLSDWIDENIDHPRCVEAIQQLKLFDAAETEILKVELLPAEARAEAYLDLTLKLGKKMPELAKRAMVGYRTEKGISAKKEELQSAQTADTMRTTKDASARPS